MTAVAAVDIGTNSVRLLITDNEGGELARHMRITRLGQGVDVTGTLAEEAIARTTAVLQDYRAELRRFSVTRVRATATSAARDAGNSEAFFAAAEQALGHRPTLLSGEEEARLSFVGATTGLQAVAAGPYLVIDIGGGSTEFVLGQTGPEALISVAMGCVRMTERHLHSDPPTAAEVTACVDDARAVLATVSERIPVARAQTVVGLAGTITTLCHLHLGLRVYDPSRSHRARLRLADVEPLVSRLIESDLAARRAWLMEPQRAEVIVGGAIVLRTVMRELAIDELIVSEADILDGLAASLRAGP